MTQFSEMELALMIGGQSVNDLYPRPKMMSFIQELKEARLVRAETDMRMTYADVCEGLYLCVLALEFLSRLSAGKKTADDYCQKTSMFPNYNEFRLGGTDFYNFIYFVSAKPERVEKIFNSAEAKRIREKTFLPVMALNGWLHSILRDSNRDNYFFMNLENTLNINSSILKDIRRMLSYKDPVDSDVQAIAVRILNAFRQKLPNIDLLPDLERTFSKKLKYDR